MMGRRTSFHMQTLAELRAVQLDRECNTEGGAGAEADRDPRLTASER